MLLSAMGCAASDLSGLRYAGATGADLLLRFAAAATTDTSLSALAARLRLPPRCGAALRRLRDAAALFGAASTRSSQPRLTEIELRLWLAGGGFSASESDRIVKLIWSLAAGISNSRPSSGGAAFLTFWEWAAGFQWVAHALEIYGVDWRAAI